MVSKDQLLKEYKQYIQNLREEAKQLNNIIKENPDAAYGNWNGYGDDFKKELGKDAFFDVWKIIDQVKFLGKPLTIAKTIDNLVEIWIIGEFITIEQPNQVNKTTKEVFSTMLQATLRNQDEYGNKFSYQDLFQVEAIYINKENRNAGLATFFYIWLINENNYCLLSDKLQYFGARKLWAKLSDSQLVKTDVIDLENEKILEKNKVLIHGKAEDSYDKAVWDKMGMSHIRFVLHKIE